MNEKTAKEKAVQKLVASRQKISRNNQEEIDVIEVIGETFEGSEVSSISDESHGLRYHSL